MPLFTEQTRRTLLLDGGMGTELIRRLHIPKRTPFSAPHVNISNPDLVKQIHLDYLEAGADIMTTNTFTANELMQKVYGKEDEVGKQNEYGVKIAREAVDEYFKRTGKRCYVAGNIGPLPFPEKYLVGKTVDDLAEIYETQLTTLLEKKVDLLLIECAYHLETVEALGKLLDSLFPIHGRVPVMLTVTINENPEYVSGMLIEDFFLQVSKYLEPDIVGFTCGEGLDRIEKGLMKLPDKRKMLVPNAGLPDEEGKYQMDIAQLAKRVIELRDQFHLDIVGGCCGTTPAYIHELSIQIKEKINS